MACKNIEYKWNHQCEALYIIRNLLRYIIKPQERYSPKGADEIQGRFAALDDMHRTSRGDVRSEATE